MNRSLILIALFLLSASAFAHHGYGGRYDQDTVVELEGELVRKLWRNPHARLYLRDAAGDTWELEAATASVLIKNGFTEDLFEVGDQLRVAGFASAVGRKEMILRNVLLPSGFEVVLNRTLGPRWNTAELIEGVNTPRVTEGDRSAPELGIYRTWSTVTRDPESKDIFPEAANPDLVWRYPLTPEATEIVKSFDPAIDNPLRASCIGKGMPMIMDQPWGMDFTDNGETIIIRHEEFDSVRIVHMSDDIEQPTEGSMFGFSKGYWDGDTFVVETTNVSWPFFSQIGVPQSEQAVFVERFTPAEQGSRLNYEMVATNPGVFTEPVTLKKYWIWNPAVVIEDYNCVD